MVNKWIGIGRLGRNPDVRYTQTGTAVANLSIACSEVWYDKDNKKQEKTEWINLVVFGKQAESCGQYLTKGGLVYVEGKLQTRNYDDKNGVKKYVTEIMAQRVEFLDSRKSDSGGGSFDAAGGASGGGSLTDSDDIPFAP